MDISELLKTAIRDRGYSLTKVAKQMKRVRTSSAYPTEETVGISQPTLTDLLRESIPFNRVEEICNIIGITLPELLAMGEERTEALLSCPHCGKPIKIKVE